MIIKWEGEDFTLDLDEIDLAQAKVIQVHCGLSLLQIDDGIKTGNPDAIRALFWLMHVQSGKSLDIDRVNFKVVKFMSALSDAIDAGNALKAELPDETPKFSEA